MWNSASLLTGTGILLIGSGLLGTLLAMRAGLEGFADAIIGLIMSAYFVGFLIGTYLCPGLIRRVGHIRAFAIFAATVSAVVLLHGLVVVPGVWLLLRVLTGVCLVGLYIVIESWLNAQVTNVERGRVFALYMLVTLLALALGQALIAVADLMAFTPFALASIMFSLGLLPVAFTSVAQPQPVAAPRLGLRFLYRASPSAVVGSIASGLVVGAFWGMGPLFAQQLGMQTGSVAAFMAAVILGGAALQWPIGRLSDRIDRRRVMLAVAIGGALVALATALIPGSRPGALLAAGFLFGGMAFSVYPLSVAHLNDHLHPDDMLYGSSGLLLLHGLGAALGPVSVGLLIGRMGPVSLLLFFAAVLLLLALFEVQRMFRVPAVKGEDQVAFAPMVRTSPEALVMLSEEAQPTAPRSDSV